MLEKLPGQFIVIDGPDGCGKSTQLARLAAALRDAGNDVITCRDPGGTEIGDRVRGVLLNYDLSTMDPACETLLFMASRAQLMAEVVRPALAAGKIVLCDRFVSATCAYQGAAGFDPELVIALARLALRDEWPDLTIILDIDAELGFERIGDRKLDAMESRPLAYHQAVIDLFRSCVDTYPGRVELIDGRVDADAVQQAIEEVIVGAIR
ncbi:MAG: dTMP kinase [Phycisphaerae bacterium]